MSQKRENSGCYEANLQQHHCSFRLGSPLPSWLIPAGPAEHPDTGEVSACAGTEPHLTAVGPGRAVRKGPQESPDLQLSWALLGHLQSTGNPVCPEEKGSF